MPTTAIVVVNSRTPASVVLDIENDGVADAPAPAQLSRSALLAQLREGPLKELLTRTSDWTVFNFMANSLKGDFVRMSLIMGGLEGGQLIRPDTTLVCQFLANALEFSLLHSGEGPIPSSLLIELRAEHSNER